MYCLVFFLIWNILQHTVADPRFPIGARGPRRGGMESQGGYVSKILYVETKESGPLGGGVCRACPSLDSPMTYVNHIKMFDLNSKYIALGFLLFYARQ